MSGALIVTGTDTGVGKTVFAAGLAAALGSYYWKAVQAGTDGTDSETAVRIAGLAPGRILPEGYRLKTPASPHLAARIDDVEIDPSRLTLPSVRPLVVEGAGGVLVPLTDRCLMIDLFALWASPVILCARTGLGTINHSLLSIEALLSRGIPVAGIIFIGEAHSENEHIVPRLAGVPSLGRLPKLDPLTPRSLAAAMESTVDLPMIRAVL